MWRVKSVRCKSLAACAGLLLLAVSCVTGPDYHRPDISVPTTYKSATPEDAVQTALGQNWWSLFNDPELDALVEQALTSNLTLKEAMARVAQSRASARSVKSSFYPVVTMNPSASRSRTPGRSTSEDESTSKLTQAASAINKVSGLLGQVNSIAQTLTGGADGTQAKSTGATATETTSDTGSSSTTANTFQIPFDISYEIDVWGRVSKSYESANAQTQASIYDLEVVRQTLLADLASDYFNLRAYDTQLEILAQNLILYEEQVDLTQSQYQAGLISETNVLQAAVQLESTRAQAADTQRQRTDLEHAIAILLGKAPADFSLEAKPLAATPPIIPAGLPGDLLRRRPDIAVAEQNLVAACAEIGVAKADFYPSFKLTGSTGYQSTDLKDILDWHNLSWSIGPSVSIPIFKGGQLKANLDSAIARYDELESSYKNQILNAFVEVEDSLTDLHMRAVASESQTKAVVAAREYLRLTHIEYEAGLTDYLQVVNAEQTLLSNELSEAQLLNQRMVSTVLLIKAIGGGWTISETDLCSTK